MSMTDRYEFRWEALTGLRFILNRKLFFSYWRRSVDNWFRVSNLFADSWFVYIFRAECIDHAQ